MTWLRAALVAALLAAAPARADIVSERAASVSVTLYHDGDVDTSQLIRNRNGNGGLAFITEKREIDVPAGPAVIKFRGVMATMVPQTAAIEGLPSGVLEQNFDYDLLTPGSLLAKSIGETVRLVRTDAKTGKITETSAKVVSGPDGAMLAIDGKLEALSCSGLPEKLVFEHVPGNLTDTPTLSVRIDAPQAGHYTITLSYIATAMNWSADYVARIAPDAKTLDLTGWLTLANFSDTGFKDAPLSVVAGNVSQTGGDVPIRPQPMLFIDNCWPTKIEWGTFPPPPPPPPPAPMPAPMMMEAVIVTAQKRADVAQSVPLAKEQQLGDYKLYVLPEPATLASRQTKQVMFLDKRDVRFERLYRFTINDDSRGTSFPERALTVLRLQNTEDSGLGKDLPAGGVSVFQSQAGGGRMFAGANRIADMAVGLPVEVAVGQSAYVRAIPKLAATSAVGPKGPRTITDHWDVQLENDRSEAVTFELRQDLYDARAKISDASEDYEQKYGLAVWRVALAAGERKLIRYVVTHPEW